MILFILYSRTGNLLYAGKKITIRVGGYTGKEKVRIFWGYGNILYLNSLLGYNRYVHYKNSTICTVNCMAILHPKKITIKQILNSVNDMHGEVFRGK